MCVGVLPVLPSALSLSAPACSKQRTTSRTPVAAALWVSQESPSERQARLAPALRSPDPGGLGSHNSCSIVARWSNLSRPSASVRYRVTATSSASIHLSSNSLSPQSSGRRKFFTRPASCLSQGYCSHAANSPSVMPSSPVTLRTRPMRQAEGPKSYSRLDPISSPSPHSRRSNNPYSVDWFPWHMLLGAEPGQNKSYLCE